MSHMTWKQLPYLKWKNLKQFLINIFSNAELFQSRFSVKPIAFLYQTPWGTTKQSKYYGSELERR